MDSNAIGKTLYVFKRLREPSTHASLAALLALFGQSIPDQTGNTIINGLAVMCGGVGVVVKEGKPETHSDL